MARFATLRAQLDTELGDADNFTFTAAEKDEALRKAIEDDPSMVALSYDEDTEFVSGQYVYDAPYDYVERIMVDAYNDGAPVLISPDWYEIVDGSIIFNRNAFAIGDGLALRIYGYSHLTKSDDIPDGFRSYVIANAIANTIDRLQEGKINRFLRNDTTMAEMQQVRANRMQEAMRLRKYLPNKRTRAF